MTDTTVVEDTTQTPPAEGQQPNNDQEEKVVLTKSQVDTLIKTAEDANQLAIKKASDAENYKKGMLKYKSKLDEAGIEEEETSLTEEKVGQILEEKLRIILPEVVKPKEDELEKSTKVISELKHALQNRPTSNPSSTGSNLDKPEPEKHYWSKEQEAELRKRGYTDEMLKTAWENQFRNSAPPQV